MGYNLLSLFLPMATVCGKHAEAAKGGERLLLQTCQSIGYAACNIQILKEMLP